MNKMVGRNNRARKPTWTVLNIFIPTIKLKATHPLKNKLTIK